MNWKRIAALAMLTGAGTSALAQVAGGPPPPPSVGAADSAAVIRNNREQAEGYNRVVSEGVRISSAEDAPVGKRKKGGATVAGFADFSVGATVRDKSGTLIATIERIEVDGAILKSDGRLAKLQLQAFGKDEVGLILGISADEFRAAIARTSVPVVVESRIVDVVEADFVVGALVRDSEGVQIGTVDKLMSDSVVLLFEGRKVRLKLASFAKDEEGLMIGVTAVELKAMLPN